MKKIRSIKDSKLSILVAFLGIVLIAGTASAAPSVSIGTPSQGDNVSGTVTISGTSSESDANSSIQNVTIYYQNSTVGWTQIANITSNVNSWSTTWDTTTVADGSSYQVNATVYNNTGGINSTVSNSFTVDNTNPTVNGSAVTAPNGGETVNGTYSITWDNTTQISDSNLATNPITINYSTDGGSSWTQEATGEANDGTYSWTTPNTESTNALVRLTAEDSAGNTNSDQSNATFTIDNVAPSISNRSPSSKASITTTSTTVSANFSDGGVGVDSNDVTVHFDGTNETGNASISATGFNLSVSGLTKGNSYTVAVNVSDTLNQTTSDTWTFSVSQGPASISGGTYTGDRIWDGSENPPLNHTWDYRSFSGFLYSFADGIGTEEMTTFLDSTSDRKVEAGDLKYLSTVENVSFEHSGWGQYQVAGFQAEKYFAGFSSSTGNSPFNVDKSLLGQGNLAKVVKDDDESHTVSEGQDIDLGGGYSLRASQVSVQGSQAMMQLYKDGSQVDSQVVNSGDDYVYEKSLGGVDNVPVIAVHVDSVFRGTESSSVIFQGIFHVSTSVTDVSTGSSFGKMEVDSTTSTSLIMTNPDSFSLSKGDTVTIFGDVAFEVADSSTLRFAPKLKGGVSEYRGTISNSSPSSWTPKNFEGFYYDMDQDVGNESLKATGTGSFSAGAIVYESAPQNVDFQHSSWGNFSVIGFQAEKYFAGYTSSPPFLSSSKDLMGDGSLSKVVMDSDESKTIAQGNSYSLKEGYELRFTQVSVQGSQAMVELYDDGEQVDSTVVNAGNNYTYEKSLGGVDNVPVVVVHVDSVFRGTESSSVIVQGAFQISESLADVSSGTEFGKLEVASTGGVLKMDNPESLSIDKGGEKTVLGDISLRRADTGSFQIAPISTVPESDGSDSTGTSTPTSTPETKTLNVSMPSTVSVGEVVEITVKDGSNPVSGASVTIDGEDSGDTDSDGLFLYTPQEAGTFNVSINASGYEKFTGEFTAATSALSVEKPGRIVAGKSFELKFTDSGGNPVSGVSVYVEGTKIGETDANGSITHTIDSGGTYSVTGEKEGMDSAVADLTVSREGSVEVVDVISPSQIEVDKPSQFKVVVQNPGDDAFNGSIDMKVGDKSVTVQAVSLKPGEVKTLTFERTFTREELGDEAKANVSFDGRKVQVDVAGSDGGPGGLLPLVGGILVLLLGGGVAAYVYLGPELVQERLSEARKDLQERLQQFSSDIESRYRELTGEEEEEGKFIGLDEEEGDRKE